MSFFDFKQRDTQVKAGSILLSEPFLPDVNFERAVILVAEHNEKGTIGFVLNKPSETLLSHLLPATQSPHPVYVGGPVSDNVLHAIHNVKSVGGEPIAKNLFWGGDINELLKIKKHLPWMRFLVGYSGWAVGQLDAELEEGAWIVCEETNLDVILKAEDDRMWREAVRSLGGRFKIYSNYPVDPRLN
ncbi:MAG: hypothetical protein CRN43_13060 [Candidatus Nephrothrix sp. EaCA]|nr:MAG: hypothetical protein CRN43_13060 [Candidatus Nephrothrix sp. EaCA]